VKYKRFKSDDEWNVSPMERKEDRLEFGLPSQPPAGKIIYFVTLKKGDNAISLTGEKPVILRYRGDVPAFILLAHVLVIFLAMLFSTRSGLEALDSKGNPRKLMIWTIWLFFTGGFILGPIMQKYAFGVYWAGFPLGTDLTDNKTLLAMLMWIWAWVKNLGGKNRRGWIVFASAFMLLVYLIPHSLFGSELDFRSPANPE
jgi:hypothetical protein